MLRQHNGLQINKGETNMKTYYFWVTMPGQSPMKVAEDGRIATEAKRIVEARFPGAKVIFAEGF